VIDTLKAVAAQWLRYERQCMIVALERGPSRWWGRPDVLGVTLGRRLIEIEIKQTVADFKANARKECMAMRAQGVALPPQQFYFLVPFGILDKVRTLCPTTAGILCPDPNGINSYSGLPNVLIAKKAAVLRECRHLTWSEVGGMVKDQSGTLVSVLGRLAKLSREGRAGVRSGEEPVGNGAKTKGSNNGHQMFPSVTNQPRPTVGTRVRVIVRKRRPVQR
jgi:hypothetical protein